MLNQKASTFSIFFQDLYKKVKSILNKLTPQKFDKLSQQIMDLPINTEERIKGIIDIIFEKVGENKLSIKLCSNLFCRILTH